MSRTLTTALAAATAAAALVVSLVGVVTAVIAFLIIRGELFLFDFKEGYCSPMWMWPKRFCCQDEPPLSQGTGWTATAPDACPAWKTWGEVLPPLIAHSKWLPIESAMIEYWAYTIIAVSTVPIA